MSLIRPAFGELGWIGEAPPLPAAAPAASTSAASATRPRIRGRRARTGWHSKLEMDGSRVELPVDVGLPFEVFLNGVPQREGVDFERRGHTLVFNRPLAKEGRLGFWRWLSLFLGVAGTYRQNDSVDVVYSRAGRRVVASVPFQRAD